MPPPNTALRRAVLAVQVLWDVDLLPADDGVVLPGDPALLVTWDECARAVGDLEPDGEPARRRLHRELTGRRAVADLHPDVLAGRLCALGLPVGHALHPGAGWVQGRVLGGALDLGLGARGLVADAPDAVVPLGPDALRAAGVDPAERWPAARDRLEQLGALAADLLARDAKGLLRPVAEADVVTLLGAGSLRRALAGAAGGLATAAVPMRRRGWTRLALVDPAFAVAAAAATDPEERGFARPLLVTADEVTQAPAGGGDALALRQPGADASPWGRQVQRS